MPFLWQKNKKEDGTEELGLSQADQDRLDKAAKAAEELPEIKSKLNGLDKVYEFINEFKADKEKELTAKKAKETKEASDAADEDFEALMITDPKAAVSKALQPTQQALLTLRADNIRREVFEDQKKFKYYHGEIKSEVDKLIAGQTLAARNDASVIENAYLTVVGRHHDEIMDGKLKDRFAGSDGGSRGTDGGNAGDTGAKDKKAAIITDDVKKLAKSFGVTPEVYAEMLDKEGIGYA